MDLAKLLSSTMLQCVMTYVQDTDTSPSKWEDNAFVEMCMLQPLNIKRSLIATAVVQMVLVDGGETLYTKHVVINKNL